MNPLAVFAILLALAERVVDAAKDTLSLLRRSVRRAPPKTLLRALIDEALPACGGKVELAIGVAAYRFRRLGGVVLNTDALTAAEVIALEAADERIEAERTASLARAFRSPLGPELTLEPVDGGTAKRRLLLQHTVSSAAAELRERRGEA
jgi:hypothetical protein